MSITLIVTKSIDRDFNRTNDEIALDDWLQYISNDNALALQQAPTTVTAPDGTVLSMAARKGASLLLNYEGNDIPFLSYRSGGELTMRYNPEMDHLGNVVRCKVVAIARHFNALITHDAGDEFLDW